MNPFFPADQQDVDEIDDSQDQEVNDYGYPGFGEPCDDLPLDYMEEK